MPLALAVLCLFLAIPGQRAVPDCATLEECRTRAREAAESGQYEAFHDLAWRAVQKADRNDPDIMLMLARAQSLSGRPLDALVMLGRLADLGVAADVSGEEFRRVRALPGWPRVRDRIDEVGSQPKPGDERESSVEARPKPVKPAAAGVVAKTVKAATLPPVEKKPEDPVDDAPAEKPAMPATGGLKPDAGVIAADALRFSTARFIPAGLAYDAVSRRFIVGDRAARKLAVVDEFSHHIANLAGAQATGFGEIAAIEIDTREGNLWVASADGPTTTLHKLQLISARSLATFTPPPGSPARFVDVAVTQGSQTLVLDAVGRRVLRIGPRGKALEVAAALEGFTPVSIAPAREPILYVAHQNGIVLVDLSSGRMTPVSGPATALTDIVRLRWHEGALVGIQHTEEGHRAVRLRLNRAGRAIVGATILDPSITTADPSATSISNGVLYYLVTAGDGGMVVRRVELDPVRAKE